MAGEAPGQPKMDEARAQLVAALQSAASGQSSSVKTIYDMTSAKLYGICIRICPDREAAEDVLQDVYVKIWRRAGSFDPARASPISWMAVITRNAALDWCRREGRHNMASQDDGIDIVDETPLADFQLEQDQQYSRLISCLDGLGSDQSRTIRRAFLDGLTYQQLSDASGTPLGTLKSWVRRGLQQLKACLGDA